MIRTTSFATILLCIATSLSGQTSFVTGDVRDDTGKALEGMVIEAYNLAGQKIRSETSRSDGSYTLALPSATYKVLAYDPTGDLATSFYLNASSFETSAELNLSPGMRLEEIDFVLPEGYFVSGVVRAPTGAVTPDVVVAAYNLNGTRRAFQNVAPSGTYTLVVPAGTYKFASYDERGQLATEFYADARSFEAANTVQITGPRSLDFALEPGGRVSGTITSAKTGSTLDGVRVYLYDLQGTLIATTTTDAIGDYSLVVAPGTYKIAAADDQKQFTPGYLGDVDSFEAAPAIAVSAGQHVRDLSFSLLPTNGEVEHILYVPVAASAPGANETFFRTDLWIHNPTEGTSEIEVTILPPPSQGDPISRTILVPSETQSYLRDVVADLFDFTGGGAIRLTAMKPFSATSRTYNDPADPDSGTSGLSIAAQPISKTLASAIILGMSNNASFRSNVGVFNPTPNVVEIRFSLYGAGGDLLGEQMRLFDPFEWFQANTIFSFVGAAERETESGFLVISSSQGSFFSYGTIVDQITGDSTLVLPAALGAPDASAPGD